AAARTERHALDVMLLTAGAGRALRRQRDHHVRDIAVGDRLRKRVEVTDRFERDVPRGVDVLVDERGRHLQRVGVVVEVALYVVVRQQRRRIDLERKKVAYGMGVLAAVQPAQRHAAGTGLAGGRIELVLEPGNEPR